MRLKTIVVFDGRLAGADAFAYTDLSVNAQLGGADKFALQVVIDGATAASTLSVYAFESGDNQDWTDETDTLLFDKELVVGEVAVVDVSYSPASSFVRLLFKVSGTLSCHVRATACLRGEKSES